MAVVMGGGERESESARDGKNSSFLFCVSRVQMQTGSNAGDSNDNEPKEGKARQSKEACMLRCVYQCTVRSCSCRLTVIV